MAIQNDSAVRIVEEIGSEGKAFRCFGLSFAVELQPSDDAGDAADEQIAEAFFEGESGTDAGIAPVRIAPKGCWPHATLIRCFRD